MHFRCGTTTICIWHVQTARAILSYTSVCLNFLTSYAQKIMNALPYSLTEEYLYAQEYMEVYSLKRRLSTILPPMVVLKKSSSKNLCYEKRKKKLGFTTCSVCFIFIRTDKKS